MRKPPFAYKTLISFVFVAILSAIAIDNLFSIRVDYWVHDSAIIFQARDEWKHTGIVVLDDDIPMRVGRKQSLPLFARAIEHLIDAGAKGVFFDARVSKEMEGRMPYALCIKNDGQALWSEPKCSVNDNGQCFVQNSDAGDAPLRMSSKAIKQFSIAPYLNMEKQLPDFLLYDVDAEMAIFEQGKDVIASERLVHKDALIARWVDMSSDHAVFRLAQWLAPEKVQQLYAENPLLDETCQYDKQKLPCRRIRLSKPIYEISYHKQLILPLSLLASCDDNIAKKTANLLKDKAVILQTTSPTEASDVIVTPMTTALFSSRLFTPGAQYLVDELETIVNQDYPHKPTQIVRVTLFIVIAVLSVFLGAYFSQAVLWLIAIVVFCALIALCFLYPIMQLWPVTASMTAYFCGGILTLGAHLLSGFRQSYLLHQFVPKQIIELLVPLKEEEFYEHKRIKAVVLMSDLAGYTTITGILKQPEYVMSLMNAYLGETSIVLQDKYNGILEAYVGDLVCYYWEYEEKDEALAYKNALCGAVELSLLQRKFFSSVTFDEKENLSPEAVAKINSIIHAGIGVTAGDVVKGNLGPKEGVKKFSILGDPLNLASRIEGITRFFNTEIIIVGDFKQTIIEEGLAVRRLGRIKVKGRTEPAILYALGKKEDERLSKENVKMWEAWILEIESGKDSQLPLPEIYNKDKNSILTWKQNGLLSADGVWQLHEK